jgi:hypothetical protein
MNDNFFSNDFFSLMHMYLDDLRGNSFYEHHNISAFHFRAHV